MKFLDQAKIYLESGKGGDIYFDVVEDMNTLIDFRYSQHFRAEPGHNGAGRNMTGAGGKDLIIRVPVGTEVLDEDKETVLADFTEAGVRMKFLKGGDGGFGNTHYKSAVNQAPRKSTPGWPGQEMAVWLRLKLIADVGLVGLPNAGKSTFLAACSNAKPKIADYPFTTLHPNLGVVKAGDRDYVIADIPGLIEGASEGQGLGDRFLGHVERTSALLHIIDCTHDDLVGAYKTIRHELTEYGAGLENRTEIIAINKADALGDELAQDQAETLSKAIGKEVHVISAVAGVNVKDILFKLANIVYKEKYGIDERDEDGSFDPT